MSDQTTAEQQTVEVAGCFFELIGRIVGQAEQLAQGLGIPSPFIKALHTLDCPMAMKELGKRMHCDPSFVTLVTDMLEKRGLARREPHLVDRRVKNVVLTDDGLALKRQIETEITARMPWNKALSDDERTQLLALLRKMLDVDAGDPAAANAAEDAMRGPLASMLVNALQDHTPQSDPTGSPAVDGGGESVVSEPSVAS
ncbi:MAG TPA: MarR family transcriptional regulator [Streptosporangiaceae bacterium]|nr:MarR family transcriptional regulator [Streptosporangiaceae bacterium]